MVFLSFKAIKKRLSMVMRGHVAGLCSAVLITGFATTAFAQKSVEEQKAQKRKAQMIASTVESSELAIEQFAAEVLRLENEKIPPLTGESKFSEWLNVAEVARLSGNFQDASLLYYGVVEMPLGGSVDKSLQGKPQYTEAIHGLAESLFEIGNYKSAEFYYKQLLSMKNHTYHDRAINRLIELAAIMRDREAVTDYYQRYLENGGGSPPSEVLYTLGRSFFLNEKDAEAVAELGKIQPRDRYYMRAQYMTAAVHVRADRYDEALKIFAKIVQEIEPVVDEDRQVVELAYLARGRIFYEQGKVDEAVDAYQYIQTDSQYLATMLYEMIWTYISRGQSLRSDPELPTEEERIKAANKEYGRALERLSYLEILEPDSELTPDIQLLVGNLEVQREQFEEAAVAFQKVLDRFEPADLEMQELMENPEARGKLLKELLALEAGGLSSQSSLPPIAARRAAENSEVADALRIFKEIQQSRDEVEATRLVIEKLEMALSQNNRTNLFRETAGPLGRAESLEGALLKTRGGLTELKRQLLEDLTPEQKTKISALQAETESLKGKIQEIATTDEALRERNERLAKRLIEQDDKLSEIMPLFKHNDMTVKILDQELAKINEGTALSPLEIQNAKKDLSYEYEEIEKQNESIKAITRELMEIRLSLKLSGGRGSSEADIRQAYSEAVKREDDYLNELLGSRGRKINDLMKKVAVLEERNGKVKASIDALVDDRIAQLDKLLDEERANLKEYNTQVASLDAEAEKFSEDATMLALEHVRKVLSRIVVRADLGFVDIAWQKKQRETKKISELQMAKAAELTRLNEAYASITQDEVN
jgi:hypothetical protein